MTEEIDYNDIAIKCLGIFIHNKCKQYALKKMKEDDFISLKDANMTKTQDVLIQIGNEKRLSTIKNSSSVKYGKFYDKKLFQMMERLSK